MNSDVLKIADRLKVEVQLMDFAPLRADQGMPHMETRTYVGAIESFGRRYYGWGNPEGLAPGLYVDKTCPVIVTDDGYRIRCAHRWVPSIYKKPSQPLVPPTFFGRLWERLRGPKLPQEELHAFEVKYAMLDDAEYQRRLAEWNDRYWPLRWAESQEIVKGLPETPFREGDAVRFFEETRRGSFHALPTDPFIITEIWYAAFEKSCHRLRLGFNHPHFALARPESPDRCCDWAHDFELTLVERGPHWPIMAPATPPCSDT